MLSTNILRKIAGGIPNPGKSAIDTFLGISQGMIKKDSKELLGYKVSGKGKVLGYMAASAAAVNGAITERDNNDMGMITGRMYRAVPSYAGYMPEKGGGMGDISAGASGDLVFALHNQRGGGHI